MITSISVYSWWYYYYSARCSYMWLSSAVEPYLVRTSFWPSGSWVLSPTLPETDLPPPLVSRWGLRLLSSQCNMSTVIDASFISTVFLIEPPYREYWLFVVLAKLSFEPIVVLSLQFRVHASLSVQCLHVPIFFMSFLCTGLLALCYFLMVSLDIWEFHIWIQMHCAIPGMVLCTAPQSLALWIWNWEKRSLYHC